MAQSIAELTSRQETIFKNLKLICINYKKDSPTRKNSAYLEERLSRLNGNWEKFLYNHQLLEEAGATDLEYFTDDVFNSTKKMYDEVLQDIMKRKAELPSASTGKMEVTPASPTQGKGKSKFSFDDIKFHVPPRETNETTEKQQDLLRQQYCNFRMFERTVEKINATLAESTEKWELEDNLNILKTKWEFIEKANWELDYIIHDEDSAYQQKYNSAERIHDDLKRKLQHKIWNNAHYENSTPKIAIPDFHGNYNQWSTFRDLYLESVHNNPILSKAQKMQHLKTKLKGEAEKLVQHLGISAENYASCWEILTHRYDNKRLLFTSYMNTFLNQPNIQQATAANIKKLHDIMMECLNGLKNIGLDTTNWGPIVVHLMVQKLDSASYNDYVKETKHPRDFPDLEEFTEFLESKFMALEALQGNSQKSSLSNRPWKSEKQPHNGTENRNNYNKNNGHRSSYFNKSQNSANAFFTTAKICPICKTNHVLMNCEKFLAMNINKRNDTVRNLHVCKNCLFSHGEKQCNSRKTCKVCHKAHHTLMHETEQLSNKQATREANSPTASSTPYVVNNVTNEEREVLLTTVLLKVKTIDGNFINLRGLLDQGSQVSLITENAAQRLRLPRRKVSAVVSGVGSLNGNCKGAMSLECQSIHSDYQFNLETLIMNRLISNLPTASFSINHWDYIENLKLADPKFNVSGPIDLLLGADIYSELILNGIIRGSDRYPVAQQTRVGWILCGNVKTFNCFVTLNEFENITRFWEAEEIPDASASTSEEQYCEEYYNETTTRLENGQYVVQMPMKPNFHTNLNDARSQALAQFLQLERKMLKNEELSNEYKRFMNDYIAMGHMKLVTEESRNRIYLPHHGVLRAESTTTKLRVVFNASHKTKGGSSLNDCMWCGPNLQKDILSLLINWRTYRYVFTADVEKLYRFIWLNENQQNLQTIIWRSSPNEPLQDWQLCTVTYGMKSAPYLAMRTLHKLAEDEKDNYPEAANVLKNFFYMDDLVYGQDTVDASKTLVAQLIELLRRGGFNLRKWKTNESSILDGLRDEQKSSNNNIDFSPEQAINSKMLGMRWNQATDSFTYHWDLPKQKNLTKRTLLSEISKLYDPLGLLSPFIIKTKLLFQKIWISKIVWDERLPDGLTTEWETIRSNINLLNKLSIPRWLQSQETNLEIHGFCGASEKAYACVIYSRVKSQDGEYVTTLITAKTKVAPLSNKITLPRLELCGALLLAKLLEKVRHTLSNKNLQIRCWSDSKVVLAWLQGDINRWERYVANRVSQINNVISANCWSYVKSEENPADCATRGLSPSHLLEYKLWWSGPGWLKTYMPNHQENNMTYSTNNEVKQTNCCVTTYKKCELIQTLLNKYSNYKRVIRVVGWILRISNNYKQRRTTNSTNNSTDCDNKKVVMCLSPQEITEATDLVIKTVQNEHFGEEIECLKKNRPISTRSKLLKLTPFLDQNGILRVRGRLVHSTLSSEAKHPIILPATGRLTELMIQEAHHNTLHGGARLTLAHVRQRFWVIGGNRTVKKYLRQCIRCHRFKPNRSVQLMADLPKERVTPSRPFTNTGVDYTGHVDVKINKGRGVRTCKAYIAVFICMVTKAIHLELVSDLTTQTFLAAFKRMCARRGTPHHVYSDNGTNFVGAAKLLQEDFERHKTFKTSEFLDEMSHLQIEWHFNAPLWPTAGGLWEAAVKAMKYHLHRVLGEQKLTYEQFTTLLAQIEACLNSRPLCPLTEDVEDLEYLTPGHFLTGGPLLSLPQEEQDFAEHDLRNRWRLVEQMNVQIWKRWSSEYLHQLQVRSKWQHPKDNLKEGSLVLVKDDHLPPGRWALGRVQELHPGTDGRIRVVTLKTKKGPLKRPITKLSPLPLKIEEPESEEEEEKRAIKAETKKRGGPTTNQRSALSLVLISILAMTGFAQSAQSVANNLKITPISSNHPIYFDDAGKIQLIHDEWTILMYYNLTPYWQANERIIGYVNQIDKLCQRISHEYTPCEAIVIHLRHELSHLADYNSMLISQHSRPKRGYFDGVGKLASTLFGVLDADFAAKYERDILNLQSNDEYLLQLMKNQTLIVEAENNVIKKTTAFMNVQFKTLRAYMDKTSSEIAKIENRAHMLYTMNDINSAAVTSTLILSDLHRILEMLMNALANIYRGHLDTHLFPAYQLIEQLNIISGSLPQGLSLPVKNIQTDLQDIYDLIHVRARITNNYLLFEIHIPLLSDEDYKIYRVIPIPFLRQGQLKLVQPSSKFIAINFIKSFYITMGEQDMNQCTSYGEDKFICFTRQPVYNLHDKDAPCEAQVFSQQATLSCVLNDVVCKETWTKLHKPNMWLFTLCRKQLTRVICNDQVTPAVIDGTGVITLKPKCLLQKKDATISTHNQLGSSLYMESDLEVPTLNSTINNIFDLSWNNAKLNIMENEAPTVIDLKNISQQLEHQKNNEKLQRTSDISSHDVYHYSVTSLLLGGLAVFALYAFLKRWCKTRKGVKTGQIPRGHDNDGVGEDIERQEMRNSTPAEPVYSEARRPKKVFNFEEMIED